MLRMLQIVRRSGVVGDLKKLTPKIFVSSCMRGFYTTRQSEMWYRSPHDMAALHAIIISHHLNEQTDMVYVCVPVSIMYPVANVAALHALLAYLF